MFLLFKIEYKRFNLTENEFNLTVSVRKWKRVRKVFISSNNHHCRSTRGPLDLSQKSKTESFFYLLRCWVIFPGLGALSPYVVAHWHAPICLFTRTWWLFGTYLMARWHVLSGSLTRGKQCASSMENTAVLPKRTYTFLGNEGKNALDLPHAPVTQAPHASVTQAPVTRLCYTSTCHTVLLHRYLSHAPVTQNLWACVTGVCVTVFARQCLRDRSLCDGACVTVRVRVTETSVINSHSI